MRILRSSVLHLLIEFLATTVLIQTTQVKQAVLTVAILLVDAACVAVKSRLAFYMRLNSLRLQLLVLFPTIFLL